MIIITEWYLSLQIKKKKNIFSQRISLKSVKNRRIIKFYFFVILLY